MIDRIGGAQGISRNKSKKKKNKKKQVAMGNSNSNGSRFLVGCPPIPPAPPEPQIQREFQDLLRSKHVTTNILEELSVFESAETKWLYIVLSKLPAAEEKEWLEPRDCVQQLLVLQHRGDPVASTELFRAIRINLVLRTKDWTEAFLAADAMKALIALLPSSLEPIVPLPLTKTEKSTKKLALRSTPSSSCLSPSSLIVEEVVHVLVALANSNQGIFAMLQSSSTPNDCIFRRLLHVFASTQTNQVRGRVLKLLGIICCHSQSAQAAVLAALLPSTSGTSTNLLAPLPVSRFRDIALQFISAMGSDESYQVTILTFLNILMNTTLNTSQRINIREELDAHGFMMALDRVQKNESMSMALKMQIAIFKKNRNNDAAKTELDRRSERHTVLDSPAPVPVSAVKAPITTTEPVSAAEQQSLHHLVSQLERQSESMDEEAKAKLTSALQTILSSISSNKLNATETLPRLSIDAPMPISPTEVLRQRTIQLPSGAVLEDGCLLPMTPQRITMESPAPKKVATNKLLLPFLQTLRKPGGLASTPACTPMATESVKKDAKKPLFPTAAPSPLPPPRPPAINSLNAPAPPADSAQDISRFRKLLSMGAPREAVEAKMRQTGVDPALLDAPTSFQVPVDAVLVPPPVDPVPLSNGPDISRFRKLLSMGAPLAAVQAKMQQAGLDPALLEEKTGFSSRETTAPAPDNSTKKDDEPSAEDPIARFRKLLAMGAPVPAVEAKMRQAGLDPALLHGPVAAPAPPASETGPNFTKFKKLLAMGAPLDAVKAKMLQAGVDPSLLDEKAASAPGPAVVCVKDDPEYAKFFKLLSMGAPAVAVKAKMRQAGLQPELLDTPDAHVPRIAPASNDPPAPPSKASFNPKAALSNLFGKRQASVGIAPITIPTSINQSNENNQMDHQTPPVLVKDDPEYAKFFKLAAMGAPANVVKTKMQMAGLRPELLDTPDAVLPPKDNNNQSNHGATVHSTPKLMPPPPPLNIQRPPPVKQTTRSFYWQHLKADDIQGTIWEEIERENNNNQTPEHETPASFVPSTNQSQVQSIAPLVVLNESDLAVLENEFPAPTTAKGDASGRHRRTSSTEFLKETSLLSPRVVFLIDRSRSNNISIIVKQFRMSHAALRDAIMKLDPNVLTIERVHGLLKILPTEEEVIAITGFQGDPTTLNDAERVLKELISIPRLKPRLLALQAKLQFPTMVRDLQSKLQKIRSASSEIAQSQEFKSILLVILQVGNKMNQGTHRGNAKGFRLSDLVKLAQLKSQDKATTLLHFVARVIRQKKGNLVRLGDAFSSLYDVQNIPIADLFSEMDKIHELVSVIQSEVDAQRLKNAMVDVEKEEQDAFEAVMTAFLNDTAVQTASTLKQELEETFTLLRDTMARFGKDEQEETCATSQDPAEAVIKNPFQSCAMNAGSFFSTIYEFTAALMKADRENELRRIKEEQKQKQKQAAMMTRSASSKELVPRLNGRSKSIANMHTAKEEASFNSPETPEPENAENEKKLHRFASVPKLPVASSSTSSATEVVSPPRCALVARPRAYTTGLTLNNTNLMQHEEEQTSNNNNNNQEPAQVTTDKSPLKVAAISPPSPVKSLEQLQSLVQTKSKKKKNKKKKKKATKPQQEEETKETPRRKSLLEKMTPFDRSSLEEIRTQLTKKHVQNVQKTHGDRRSRGPEDSKVSETEIESSYHGNNSPPASPERHKRIQLATTANLLSV